MLITLNLDSFREDFIKLIHDFKEQKSRKITNPNISLEKYEEFFSSIYNICLENVPNLFEKQETLKEPEKKYRTLIDNISDVIVEVNLNREFTYISPQVSDILGYQPHELIGTKVPKIFHPDDDVIDKEEVRKALLNGFTLFAERRLKRKDGKYIYMSIPLKIDRKHKND